MHKTGTSDTIDTDLALLMGAANFCCVSEMLESSEKRCILNEGHECVMKVLSNQARLSQKMKRLADALGFEIR